jgi:transposase
LNYLHRLGFVLKRPKKRLLKANKAKQDAFIVFYAALRAEALASSANIFFVDEAHFRADADLRGKWVLSGEPALVDSTCPRLSEKATYYSGICLETGEVESMEVSGNCNAETSAAFLRHLRGNHRQPLIVIWDNGPAHYGEAIRDYLTTPELNLRLVPLPGYSPDFNADEAIWDWVREEVTGNFCLGTKAKVQEKVGQFFHGLIKQANEVKQRCRTVLQASADQLIALADKAKLQTGYVDPTLALV